MTIVLRSRAGVGETGSMTRLLKRTLEAMGTGEVLINPADMPRDAVQVSYGVNLRQSRVPTMNQQAGVLSKLEQMTAMQARGVSIVPTATIAQMREMIAHYGVNAGNFGIWLGRKLDHTQGKDIMTVFQPEEVEWRVAAGAAFFTQYVPIAREFRVWSYRRRHMGTYEKRMARPAEYSRLGRSAHNGFGFYIVRSEDVPRGAVEQAKMAVEALDLDYGAADIIEGKDGRFYVLEVNTAPGIEGTERAVLRAWCEHIMRWSRNPTKRSAVDWTTQWWRAA